MNPTNNTPSRRKLQLNRETLRELDQRESIEVVGGAFLLGIRYSEACTSMTCLSQTASYQTCMTYTK